MNQADAFLEGEGDNYHERNRTKALNRRVLNPILGLGLQSPRILEVGCGDGRYLDELNRYLRGRGAGVDPSSKAISEGKIKYPLLDLHTGIATDIGIYFDRHEFDLIIFGFCLYLIDRDDLFEAVSDSDYLLKPNGFIAIHDFNARKPKVVPYQHLDGIKSYHMDYPKLWLANPAYKEVTKEETGKGTAITIIRKVGWPQES